MKKLQQISKLYLSKYAAPGDFDDDDMPEDSLKDLRPAMEEDDYWEKMEKSDTIPASAPRGVSEEIDAWWDEDDEDEDVPPTIRESTPTAKAINNLVKACIDFGVQLGKFEENDTSEVLREKALEARMESDNAHDELLSLLKRQGVEV